MGRNTGSELNDSVGVLFTRFPLGCPLTLISVGSLVILAFLVVAQVGGTVSVFAAPMGIILVAAGLIVLPFGIVTRFKRSRPVVLRCPHCGAESRTARRPFSVQRWDDVPFALVVCSKCGRDFTVDHYSRLV